MIYTRTQNGGLGITCQTGPYHQRAPQALLEGKKRNDQKVSTRTRRMRHARGPLQPIPSLQAGRAGPKRHRRRTTQWGTERYQITNGANTWPVRRHKGWAPQCGWNTECNSWIRAGTFTSREAIDAILLRSNCIPTKNGCYWILIYCMYAYHRLFHLQCCDPV